MNWLDSRLFRVLSFVVLLFFSWTFGGFFDLAFAVKDIKELSASADQPKAEKPEEKLQEALDNIEQILTDTETDTDTKKNKLKTKKAKIGNLDKEIKKQFKATEKKLKEAGLPQEILKRHHDFVKLYKDNLKELNDNLDAIEKAKGKVEVESEVEKTKKFLKKVKPPKKHVPLDPNKLPHRTPDVIKKEPRLNYSDDRRVTIDDGRGTNDEKKTNSQQLTADREPILVALNGPLAGLLDDSEWTVDSSQTLNTFTDDLFDSPLSDISNSEPFLLAAADPPTSDDLAETIEVQFTPEITAKALELENNPVKIYNFVRNNIEFVPTYGSIQGADYCLQTKLCNAVDTASLLIALLRVSGIHARYVEGTVEIPIEKVKNWVGGFTDSIAALDFIASGGIPVTGLISGGEVVMVRMEHVWVEAYVDYIPYRGAVAGPGDTWIPLDASFKQYNYVDGIDADTAVPIDFNALLAEVENQSTINNEIPSITGLPTGTIQNQVSDFQTRLNEYLAANFPQVDNYYELDKTLHGYREIIQKNLRFLPNTLAGMKVITELDTFSEIPDTLRHKINFKLSSTDLIFGNTSFTYTVFLPDIAGKRITLSYSPATAGDAQVMSDAEGILNFPLYLVEVIPELKIEGQTVAAGTSISMGSDQTFERSFYRPNGSTGRVSNNVYAGEYYAVGLNVNKVNFQYLYDRANLWQPDAADNKDDRLGELLYLTSMFYFAWSDYFADKLSRSNNIVSLRHTSESLVGMRFNASYVFGTPISISSVGLNMDIDRDVVSVASKTNDSDTKLWFMIQTGLFGSSLEHSLFESIMGFDAVSAVKFLDLASQQNIPIYIIDSENSQRVDELQISFEDKQDIKNLINAGRLVLVPESNIQYFDYTGIGYIAIDMNTGSGAYLISGGLNGGDTIRENVEALLELAKDLLGKAGRPVYKIYKTTIENLLANYPDIADDPDVKFKEWTEEVLFVGYFAQRLPLGGRIKIIIGQQILYSTMIMLSELTIPF